MIRTVLLALASTAAGAAQTRRVDQVAVVGFNTRIKVRQRFTSEP